MAIDFYYHPMSPPCRVLILLAKTIGVHFNLILVNLFEGEQMAPDYVKMNPQHTVPTINDNGYVLWESRAIMIYLIRKYAKNDSLYPRDPKLKGIIDQRMHFDLYYLFGRMLTTYVSVVHGKSTKVNPEYLAELESSLEILDKLLESSTYMAGENLTIADYSAVVTVGQLKVFGFDINRYDNVASWYKRCQENMEKYGFEEQVEIIGDQIAAIFRNNVEK